MKNSAPPPLAVYAYGTMYNNIKLFSYIYKEKNQTVNDQIYDCNFVCNICHVFIVWFNKVFK